MGAASGGSSLSTTTPQMLGTGRRHVDRRPTGGLRARRYRRGPPEVADDRQRQRHRTHLALHLGIEIDERGNFLRHAVGDAGDHHAAIGIADKNDIHRSASSITPITSWICVSRSISRLSRCLRAPMPVKVGAYTSCPALRSLGVSSRQTTLPAQEPCTRTNVAIASPPL